MHQSYPDSLPFSSAQAFFAQFECAPLSSIIRRGVVLDACRELNVALVAYVPLASGRLASTSPSSNRGSESLQTALTTIAHTRSKSVPQVVLNWLLRRDEHIIPIPGATNARHVQENAEALTWELSDEEFAAIDQASRPPTS